MFGQFGNYIIFNPMSLQSSLNFKTKILKDNNLLSTKTYNTVFLIMRERATQFLKGFYYCLLL